MDDFESVGVINGVPSHEFNLDNLEDKPWRKPGADITGMRFSGSIYSSKQAGSFIASFFVFFS